MLFAMDSLGRLTEILELKFIQRVAPCQIHHYGSYGSRQADWPDDPTECAGPGGSSHKMTF
jgi:hypothetical protein